MGNVEAAGSFAQNIAQLKKELRTRTKDLKEVAEKSDKERQASEAIIGKFNVIKTNMEERRLDIELTKKKILAFMQDKGMDASALESVQQMVKMNQVLLEKQCLNADSIDLTGGTISAETKANFKMMRKECIRRMQRMLQGLDKIESELKTFASFCAYLAAPTPATSPDAAAAKKENKNNINSNTHDNTSSGSSSSYSSHGNDSPTAYHTSYSAHKSTPSAVHNNTTASASDRSQTTTKPAKKRHLNTPHNSQYMQTPHNSHTHHTHGYNYRDRDASEPIVKNLQKNISDAHHRSMGDRDRHSRRSY